jgi:hypothetical protein
MWVDEVAIVPINWHSILSNLAECDGCAVAGHLPVSLLIRIRQVHSQPLEKRIHQVQSCKQMVCKEFTAAPLPNVATRDGAMCADGAAKEVKHLLKGVSGLNRFQGRHLRR